jgi:hypothetical protein
MFVKHLLIFIIMKKSILNISFILVVLTTVFYSCQKKESILPHQSSKNVNQTNQDPPEDPEIYFDSLDQYLDGELSNLSIVNSSDVEHSIYHEEYDQNGVYHFTSDNELQQWLNGKSFENEVLRRNYVMDSLDLVMNPADTSEYSPFERNVPNSNGFFAKINLLNTKRLSLGGATIHENCIMCGQSLGQTRTIVGWTSNVGSIRNKATQLNHGGAGWNTWCMNFNFKKPRFSQYFVGARNVNLVNTSYDNNIESVY